GAGQREGLAVEEEAASVGLILAGDHASDGGLAGGVVADERNHLVGVEFEVEVDDGLDGSEALDDALQPQEWWPKHGCQRTPPEMGERSAAAASAPRTSAWAPSSARTT